MSVSVEPEVSPTTSATTPASGSGAGRLAVGLVLLAVVGLLALLGGKLAANAGWLPGGGAPAIPGAPGVNANGQLVRAAFRQAPDFTLRTFDGATLRLADLRGQPVLVNFWASWCPPCRDEAPLLERTWRAYRGQGVAFVGVDIWDAEPDARRFLQEFGVTYPNGPDPGTVALDYGLTGIPETFFIDRQGQVMRKWIGPLGEAPLRAFLDELVGSAPGA